MEEKKSELRKLAEFVHGLEWEQIPEEVRQAVVDRVLDLVSVAAGASDDPMIRRIADTFEQFGGTGKVHVWGCEKTWPLPVAAFLDEMLAHTLELDDVHSGSKTHGSASLIPAAWTCAEYLGKTGKEFLTAVVAGYETVARIGMALGVSAHRNRGWHATSTCGVFGCAAACAKLLELDTEGILSSLGMAGTQSSGVWAFLGDGSNCKVLHTGRAASNGLEAVFLAASGMTGPEHIMEGQDGGLLYAMSDGGDASRISAGLGTEWEILKMDMKPYPCCRSTHCAVDCALALRERIDPEQIREIDISTYLVGYKQCAVSEGCLHPKQPMDAKFSTRYCVAAALLYGRVSMKEFEPQVVMDAKVQTLLEKVKVREDERFTSQYPSHWGCEMEIVMKNGAVFRYEVSDPSGSVVRPLTRKQAMEKAENFLQTAYPEREKVVIGQILNLESAVRMPVLG
ncbi:MAG: MmgE/PrpD family protein [Clostridiales bacterium]|nr:MmgE/PrpD family protein [Clostridiales bacterium]